MKTFPKLILIIGAFSMWSCEVEKVSFNQDVRPILNARCVSCHGGVKQAGGFGLTFRDDALKPTANGKLAIIPGSPGGSEIIKRIRHKDPELRMPLHEEPLTEDEISILEEWIDQGAEWETHWAYVVPDKPEVPATLLDWGKNEIDRFILAGIEDNGLQPSPDANRYDLIRRVALDITGLPPEIEQMDSFFSGKMDYEEVVDELLGSPAYGEHWAVMWLDLARYADSRGYEADGKREISSYRDWVIKAFNKDMPFDEFTIEQLAGDLLPNPTREQIIATGFNRNSLTNEEGGTYNEEYRVAAVIDRTNTTWEVWQSTTMSCVQCHSHPYDPIRQKDYYGSFAFFNNTSDWDVPSEIPLYREYNEDLEEKLAGVIREISERSDEKTAGDWERFIRIAEPRIRPEDFTAVENTSHFNRGGQDHMQVNDSSSITISGLKLGTTDRIYINIGCWSEAEVLVRESDRDGEIIGKAPLDKNGWKNVPIVVNSNKTLSDIYIEFRSENNWNGLLDGFLVGQDLPGPEDSTYDSLYASIDQLLNSPATKTSPVMVEKEEEFRRASHILERGNWQVKGEEVQAGLPGIFGETGTLETRLDLARWLVSERNPLTARVMVNRVWANIFGRGLVETSEDFGTLGNKPSHPELLDWLAVKFSGEWEWSIKRLVREIVMSATYRQSSKADAVANEKDPDNIWLARSPRKRLSAEQVRDQALAVSGLLSRKMYGPSVMPPQPEGIWNVVYSNLSWNTPDNEDAYRRGIYTFMRRSTPYPSFLTFDGTSREVCVSRRIITNTPLQALVTLNDPVYLEAARHLAEGLVESEKEPKEWISNAYRTCIGKPADDERMAILGELYESTLEHYKNEPEETVSFINEADPQLASLVVTVNTIMNLDEFIMKN